MTTPQATRRVTPSSRVPSLMRTLVFAIILASGWFLLASACGGGAREVKTPAGTFAIKEVRLTDRYQGFEARGGFKIVVISLEPKNAGGAGQMGTEQEFETAMDQVYITSGGGSRIVVSTRYMEGDIDSGISLLELGFVVPVGAQDFKLFWPDNPPVDLGE